MIRFIFTVARHTSMWKMRAPQMNRSPFQISGDPSTCGPGRVGEAWDGNHGHSSIHSSNISKTVTWSASFSPWPGTPLCERCARHKWTGHRFKSQVTHPKKSEHQNCQGSLWVTDYTNCSKSWRVWHKWRNQCSKPVVCRVKEGMVQPA